MPSIAAVRTVLQLEAYAVSAHSIFCPKTEWDRKDVVLLEQKIREKGFSSRETPFENARFLCMCLPRASLRADVEGRRDCAHWTMKTVSSMRMCAEILGETVIDKLKLFRVRWFLEVELPILKANVVFEHTSRVVTHQRNDTILLWSNRGSNPYPNFIATGDL